MGEGGGMGGLLGGVKKLKIDDQDASTPDRLKQAFPHHWTCTRTTPLTPFPGGGAPPITLFSHLNITQDHILCGLSNGELLMMDPARPSPPLKKTSCRRHEGLTCLVSSHTNPELGYSGSGKDGMLCLWDFRTNNLQPVTSYSVGSQKMGGGGETSPKTRPILSLDISPSDQVLCAGTELQGEDSFIFFWDVRVGASQLLGAYWESHSDDVTTVHFHPEKFNQLATGSTDGLVNVFDLLQPTEEDALQSSFNTESSVDSLHWSCSLEGLPSSCLSVVTHANQVQLWDVESGDKFGDFDRQNIAQAMMRSNPDAVYVNKCYPKRGNSKGSLGLLTCSLKGSCTRFLEIKGNKLEPSGLFLDHNSIVQSAEFISKSNKWITFDEEGTIRSWSLAEPEAISEIRPAKKLKLK